MLFRIAVNIPYSVNFDLLMSFDYNYRLTNAYNVNATSVKVKLSVK